MGEHSKNSGNKGDLFYILLGVVTIVGVPIAIGYMLLSYGVATEVMISAAIFVLLWVTLGHKVFKPFIDLLEEREARTEGDERNALEVDKESEAVFSKIELALQSARLKGIKARDKKALIAKDEARQIIDKVKESAQRELTKAREELELLRTQVRSELESEVQQISEAMVVKVIERGDARVVH